MNQLKQISLLYYVFSVTLMHRNVNLHVNQLKQKSLLYYVLWRKEADPKLHKKALLGTRSNYGKQCSLGNQRSEINLSRKERNKKILQRSTDMNSDKKMTIKNEITIRTKGLGR